MGAKIKAQKTRLIAFQGEPGAYSELAAFEYFAERVNSLPCQTFEDVFQSVVSGKSSHGLIPVENSLAGSIHRNFDLMLRHNLHIVGEYHLRVIHCLMALPGTNLGEIQRVFSHPQALAQCEGNLMRMGVLQEAKADTAGSARLIREKGDKTTGALASKRAAEVYGLDILVEHMEDNPANFTRFLVMSKEPLSVKGADDGDYKTSIVFNLSNKPGALFKALSVFALRDIDLTKIESRPIQGQPWEYMFYVDFAGYVQDLNCKRALEHLAELAPFLRMLGSYPRHYLNTP
jgi:prephenate dehydratase